MFLYNKKIIVFILLVCVGLTLMLLLLLFPVVNRSNEKQGSFFPTITPFVNKKSPNAQALIRKYSKTVVGSTPEKDVLTYPGLIKEEKIDSNTILFTFNGPFSYRNNEIITRNGVVVYEKNITTDYSLRHPSISDFLNQYGPGEKEILGSKKYGRFAKTYIYASKGFAFIGNPSTDEVDEFQAFLPTTLEEYFKNWGKDIDPNIQGERI